MFLSTGSRASHLPTKAIYRKTDTFACALDPIRTGSNIILSNNNLTATCIASLGVWQSATGTPSNYALWPLVYYETQINNFTPDMFPIGVCQSIFGAVAPYNYVNSYYLGQDASAWGLYTNGTWYFGASISSTFHVTGHNGDVYALALDQTNGFLWARNVTQNEQWNGTYFGPTADPYTQVGSVNYQGYFNQRTLHPGCSLFTAGNSVTFNFDGPFVGKVPRNYRTWRGRPIP